MEHGIGMYLMEKPNIVMSQQLSDKLLMMESGTKLQSQ